MKAKSAPRKQSATSAATQQVLQMSLFESSSTRSWRTVVTQQELLNAWNWLTTEINGRPDSREELCLFDHKLWGSRDKTPLRAVSPFTEHVAQLYLVTELGDLQTAINLAHQSCCDDLEIEKIDPDCRKLIESPKRFRASLSEHLSFWVTLAMEARDINAKSYARSRPNLKPERQGPDGVTISVYDNTGSSSVVRVHSVKNSIKDPKTLVSTAKLRKQKVAANEKLLLDEFWFISRQGKSFNELDECLSTVCNLLQLSADKKLRISLLHRCVYDATIVANDTHAAIDLFDGYQHVVDDAGRRAATFIGADNWSAFSEATRTKAISLLKAAGLW